MIWRVRIGLVLGLALCCCLAGVAGAETGGEDNIEAPAKPHEKNIFIDLNVNYRLGYRDGSWVPVDVIVANTLKDVEGYIEVRTYAGDQLQSPIYHIPAESPENSKKRFRLHCLLNHATRIEAMLYNKRKAVQPIPAFLMIQPIRSEDLLGLVIDREPTDYGFLNAALDTGSQPVRFYREEVPPQSVQLLADYVQCYYPYDVIILGDIEPDRISERHRDLLARYVNEGGVLIVCTGANAPRYRGTWAENLAGVTVGETIQLDDVALADKAFDPEAATGTKAERSGLVAQLTPRDSGMKVFGKDTALATLRPLGSGYVVTVAVDAASHLLQDTEGYRRLWCELCDLRNFKGELNYEAATRDYVERLPYISGIKLFSKTSVMLYLMLYFLLGIVANWFVCNALKRRELAWLFLVIFSLGFTAYAMVFGTAGRTKSTQVNQVEVVHVLPTSPQAQVRSLVSVLTARSKRLSIGLRNEFSLAEDVTSLNATPWDNRPRRQESRPFYLTQTATPRIDDFMVGASELRLVDVRTEIPVTGGIDGALVRDKNGLHGTLINNTGLALSEAFVLLDGNMYTARKDGDNIVVDASAASPMDDAALPVSFRQGPAAFLATRRQLESITPEMQQHQGMYVAFLNRLFAADDSVDTLDDHLGPFLVAWLEKGPMGLVDIETRVDKTWGATIVIADIVVNHENDERITYQNLPVLIDANAQPRNDNTQGEYTCILSGNSLPIQIALSPIIQRQQPKELTIDLVWRGPYNTTLAFTPDNVASDWATTHLIDSMNDDNNNGGGWGTYDTRSVRKYRISDTMGRLDPATDTIPGKIYIEQKSRDMKLPVSIRAQVQLTQPILESEDWKPWP